MIAAVVRSDQDHVPSAFLVTVPLDALNVTVSAGTSVHVPLLVSVVNAFPVTFANATVNPGALFVTVYVNDTLPTAPALSVAVIVTDVDAVSSIPARLHDHVPSEFLVMLPDDALNVTTSPASESDHVPLFARVVPSLPLTDAFDTVINGG